MDNIQHHTLVTIYERIMSQRNNTLGADEAPQVNSPETELLAGMAGGRLYVHDFKAG